MVSVPRLTPGLQAAFKAAEAVRRELVEARQKVLEAKEKEGDEEKKAKMDEDAPGNYHLCVCVCVCVLK